MSFVANLPVLGPSALALILLAWLVIHYVRQGTADRAAYQKFLENARKSHSEEIDNIKRRHREDNQELRDDNTELRKRITSLEDTNGKLQGQVNRLRYELWQATGRVIDNE